MRLASLSALCVLLVLSADRLWATAVTIGPGVQVGTISQLNEVSGLVVSRSLANTFWVHNDSGDTARFYAINKSGSLLGTISLQGGTAIDWEDIAIGPKPGGGNYLYIADIGDNSANRTAGVNIYRLNEPTSSANAVIAPANYTKVTIRYPDLTPRNAESLIVDPLSGDLFVVTKALTGQVYRAPSSIFDTPATTASWTLMGNLNVSLPFATAADISPDGKYILVRNLSTTAYLFQRGAGQSVWDAMQGSPTAVTLQQEQQGEAIGWAPDGSGFYTTSEFSGAGARPIYFYSFSVPEPSTGGLLMCALGALAIGAKWRRRRRA